MFGERSGMFKELEHYVYHFQPQYSLKSGNIKGYESLIRFESGKRTILPYEFLNVLEKNRLWPSLWKKMLPLLGDASLSLEGRLAVNVAPHEFEDGSIVKVVQRCIAEGIISGDRLELEITEQSNIHQYREICKSIDKLNMLDVHVVIDDFGSGYSGLSRLQNLNVQGIKIDRTHITNIESSDIQQAIVESIISIANVKECYVLAEGIETEPELNTLKSLGCQYGQGYLFSKPQPVKSFIRPHAECCPLTDSPARTKLACNW